MTKYCTIDASLIDDCPEEVLEQIRIGLLEVCSTLPEDKSTYVITIRIATQQPPAGSNDHIDDFWFGTAPVRNDAQVLGKAQRDDFWFRNALVRDDAR